MCACRETLDRVEIVVMKDSVESKEPTDLMGSEATPEDQDLLGSPDRLDQMESPVHL